MPRYTVLEKSYIDGRIYEAGESVFYGGHQDFNLEPTDEEGRAAKEYYNTVVNPKRVSELFAANPDPSAVNMTALAEAVAKAVIAAQAQSAKPARTAKTPDNPSDLA